MPRRVASLRKARLEKEAEALGDAPAPNAKASRRVKTKAE